MPNPTTRARVRPHFNVPSSAIDFSGRLRNYSHLNTIQLENALLRQVLHMVSVTDRATAAGVDDTEDPDDVEVAMLISLERALRNRYDRIASNNAVGISELNEILRRNRGHAERHGYWSDGDRVDRIADPHPVLFNSIKASLQLEARGGGIVLFISTDRGSYRKPLISLRSDNDYGQLVFYRHNIGNPETTETHGLRINSRGRNFVIAERKE